MKSQFLTLILSALFSLFGMQAMSAGNWEKSFKEAVEVKQAVMQADTDSAVEGNSRAGLIGSAARIFIRNFSWLNVRFLHRHQI